MTEAAFDAMQSLMLAMLSDADCQASWEGMQLMKPPNAEEWATFYRQEQP